MKKLIFVLPILLLTFTSSLAQTDYAVVFDLTSKDTIDHQMAIRWVNEVLNAEPTAKVEVVFFGQSLNMVVKEKSVVSDAVARLATTKKAVFKVCEVAMKRHNIGKEQLIGGVETVRDGIYEIISKQREGWGYIKVSH